MLIRGDVATPCFPGEPCDPPAVGAFLVFSADETTVARVPVGASGDFELWLPPGDYAVRAEPAMAGISVSPSKITVPSAGSTTATFRVQSTNKMSSSSIPTEHPLGLASEHVKLP